MDQLTNNDPKLPKHDKGATNSMGSHLGRVNGHRGVLGANANTHHESCPEETLPILGKGRSDGSSGKAGGREENLASSSEVVVEGINNKGTTATVGN